MSTQITLEYRIKSSGGMLYVRDGIRGEIVARIPSQKSTTDPDSAEAVVSECGKAFLGGVHSLRHDIDSVIVTCVVFPK